MQSVFVSQYGKYEIPIGRARRYILLIMCCIISGINPCLFDNILGMKTLQEGGGGGG